MVDTSYMNVLFSRGEGNRYPRGTGKGDAVDSRHVLRGRIAKVGFAIFGVLIAAALLTEFVFQESLEHIEPIAAVALFAWAMLPAAPVVTGRRMSVPLARDLTRSVRMDTFSSINALPVAVYITGLYAAQWQAPVLIASIAYLLREGAVAIRNQTRLDIGQEGFTLAVWSVIFLMSWGVGYVVPPTSAVGTVIGAAVIMVASTALRGWGAGLWQRLVLEGDTKLRPRRLDGRALIAALIIGAMLGIVIAIEVDNSLLDIALILFAWLIIMTLLTLRRTMKKPSMVSVIELTGQDLSRFVERGEMDEGLAKQTLMMAVSRVAGLLTPATLVVVSRKHKRASRKEWLGLYGADSRHPQVLSNPDLVMTDSIVATQSSLMVSKLSDSVKIRMFDEWLVPVRLAASDHLAIKYAVKAALMEIELATVRANHSVARAEVDLETGLISPSGLRVVFDEWASDAVAAGSGNAMGVFMIRLFDDERLLPPGSNGVTEMLRATRSAARKLVSMDEASPYRIQCSVMGPGAICLVVAGLDSRVHPLGLSTAISNTLKAEVQPIVTESAVGALSSNVGVAVYPRQGFTFDTLVVLADQQALNQPQAESDPWLPLMVSLDDAVSGNVPSPVLVEGWMLSSFNGSSGILVSVVQSFKDSGDAVGNIVIVPRYPIVQVDPVAMDHLQEMGVRFALPLDKPLEGHSLEQWITFRAVTEDVALSGVWSQAASGDVLGGLEPIILPTQGILPL